MARMPTSKIEYGVGADPGAVYTPAPYRNMFPLSDSAAMFKRHDGEAPGLWQWRIESPAVPETWVVGIMIEDGKYGVAVKRHEPLYGRFDGFTRSDFADQDLRNVGTGGISDFRVGLPTKHLRDNGYTCFVEPDVVTVRVKVEWVRWVLAGSGWDVYVKFEKVEPIVGKLAANEKDDEMLNMKDCINIQIDSLERITTVIVDASEKPVDIPLNLTAVLRAYIDTINRPETLAMINSNPGSVIDTAHLLCRDRDAEK